MSLARCALFFFVVGNSLTAAQERKPDRSWFIYEREPAAPASLTERARAASLIVRGRIEGRWSEVVDSKSDQYPRISTTHLFRVLEVLKGPESAVLVDSRIRIFTEGGTIEKDRELLQAVNRGLPELLLSEYVLFLEFLEARQGYRILWGADGLVETADAMVRSPGSSTLSKEINLRSRVQFLSDLRRAVDGTRN
jgi:hypothetical protein